MAHHKLPELLCHKAQWQLLWYYAVSQLAMPVLVTSISCHHKNFSKRWTSFHRQNAFASWKKSLAIVYFKFFSDPCYKQTIYALILCNIDILLQGLFMFQAYKVLFENKMVIFFNTSPHYWMLSSLSLSLSTSKCWVLPCFNKRSSRSVLLQGCRSDIYSYTQVKGSMAHHYAGVTSPEVEARSWDFLKIYEKLPLIPKG